MDFLTVALHQLALAMLVILNQVMGIRCHVQFVLQELSLQSSTQRPVYLVLLVPTRVVVLDLVHLVLLVPIQLEVLLHVWHVLQVHFQHLVQVLVQLVLQVLFLEIVQDLVQVVVLINTLLQVQLLVDLVQQVRMETQSLKHV